jgi:RNA polymerase sigma-70 factor (ECF subfamily)
MPAQKLKDLAEAAKRRDTAAINVLFEYFMPALYARALRICGNTPLAQDVVQDTLIIAYQNLSKLREPAAIYSWLVKILLNTCYRQMNKDRYRQDKLAALPSESSIISSVDAHLDSAADQQLLFQSMSHLSDELNSCILLRYFSDFTSYEDIAAILGIPVGTVRSRLAAAREKLIKKFQSRDDAGDKYLHESRTWSAYYKEIWKSLYDDGRVRDQFYHHLNPLLDIRFTSGKRGQGRKILEYEISQDLVCGTRFEVEEVISSGSISIIQGTNLFTPDFPNRCAPQSVFVLFRKDAQVEQLHIYDSSRPEKK